ncbi:hypothetical protein BX600DRAFT_227689 [Xylariales sp. PMI_506]|nr:hypothetical protein BX600DRAFT_227689 [Xylariales sp. PMI_506]
MLSFRCQRCWTSFDTKQKITDHALQQYQCKQKEMTGNERFMTLENEAKIERTGRRGSEEELWWDLFRLLIHMRERDILSLMQDYQPYYVIPPMVLPESMFQLPVLGMGQPTDEPDPSPEQLPSVTPSAFPIQSTFTSSQSIHIPVWQVFSGNQTDHFDPLSFCSVPFQGANIPSNLHATDSLASSSSSSNNLTSTASIAMSPGVPLTGLPMSELHLLRRNNERLRERQQRAEADCTELRRARQENVSDLDRMDSLLECLLGSGELSDGAYSKLSGISSLLCSVRKRSV